MTPSKEDLWFVPLGGTGEIGMNLNLYGHNGKWIMIDCGVSFGEPLTAPYKNGNLAQGEIFDIVAPDPTFIVERKSELVGIVLTHAHEDHIGAIPYLWERFQCPVYATAFTCEVVRRKLIQVGLVEKVPLIEVDPASPLNLSHFTLRWMSVTHSIPEPFALLIETPVGNLLHTADWKIDAQPVTGKPFSPTYFKQIANQKILALVGDSTNATKPGFSVSERSCYEGLLTTIRNCRGRVVVGCFASNVARLISLARIAVKTNRYMALLGRSMLNMYSIAKQSELWPDDLTLIDASHLGYLPPDEVLLVATGSQGETNAALMRLAEDRHHSLRLDKGDNVIFSTIVIPGNEKTVEKMQNQFSQLGVNVIASETSQLPIHASGHPCQEELKLMYRWVQPEVAIPVHGESVHLIEHGNIAKAMGVKKQLVGQNGDLYKLAPQVGIRRQVIKSGRLPIIFDSQ